MQLEVRSIVDEINGTKDKNCIFLSPIDYNKLQLDGQALINTHIFQVDKDEKTPQGAVEIGLFNRNLLGVLVQNQVNVSELTEIDPKMVDLLEIQLDYLDPNNRKKKTALSKQDTKTLEIDVRSCLRNRFLINGQKLFVKSSKKSYIIECYSQSATKEIYCINAQTIINMTSQYIDIFNISAPIFQTDFSLNDLGVGGLDEQFTTIFRRAFASRVMPRETIEGLGIKHIKGMVFYGPPGCGKTLLARQIGTKVLKTKSIKYVTGPSLLSKYVGEGERNARELFDDAINDLDKDNLHLIIMDEADSLLKKRGTTKDGTGAIDGIVNTILAKLDGTEQLNNILVICMTNRLDLIDEAILRSGRLEVHVEIGLPNLTGRQDILKIHTATMIKNEFTSKNLDLGQLAEKTTGYTGADLESVVKTATSLAVSRHISFGKNGKVQIDEKNKPCVTQKDFEMALSDFIPTFGNVSEEIDIYTKIPFIKWNHELVMIYQSIADKIANLRKGNITSLLITGDSHSGKTKFLCDITKNSKVTCTKMISPEKLAHVSIIDRPAHILNVFEQCCRAESSILILDGFERLIGWNQLGYRYDSNIVQIIMTIIRSYINPERKLILMISCNDKQILKDIGILEMIDDYDYAMCQKMTKDEANYVLEKLIDKSDSSQNQSFISKLFDNHETILTSHFFKNVKFFE